MRRAALCGALAIGGLIIGAPSSARAADLSKDIRTASDETANQPTISAYVTGEVADINQEDDPKKASVARESLIDEVRGLVPPSPQFLDSYCQELNTQFAPLLSPASTASIRVRMNLAIVVAQIAAVAQDARLAPLVILELKDPSEAVVLWGLKAAHEVIVPALGVLNLKTQLITAVTTAAQRLKTGPIIAAAYNALTVGDAPGQNPVDLIGPVQNLLAWRIQQYAVGVPAEPPADAHAAAFLTELSVWKSNPVVQQKTVQLIVDLIGAATADLATAQPEDRDELTMLLARVGEVIQVISTRNAKFALLVQAANPLVALNPHNTPPAAAQNAASVAINGLAQAFPGLKMPKGFVATAPTTSTAPQPTP